ncbi:MULTISPECIES: hypothetical protein [Sphingomonas]|uniref:Uncharacterized protein n=1 Tax=Sphingomonas paucimobilis TaxID=13689 RepID=A0A7Y2KM80_SPHPI|nr:hypothetical protein [Sphingomonas paucimobilis]MCM3681432.1 hypothetical protein [Sphingomonas paucimobilis]NNG56507.1 hypothetical protein [Sphingomonas paucimobilis]
MILRFPKMSLAGPLVRTRGWQRMFVLFRVVTLQDDHRRHILFCRTVRCRYSMTQRRWLWTRVR